MIKKFVRRFRINLIIVAIESISTDKKYINHENSFEF